MRLADPLNNPGFTIQNNIYVGSVGTLITGDSIKNYEYVSKNHLKELTSSPLPPYYLQASGAFASYIYETCHGINSTSIDAAVAGAGNTGDYNFYMAPYGPGYYQPPVGELPTFAEQTFGFSKLRHKQADDLNLSDYLKIFGLRIASKINNFIPCKTYSLTAFHEGITDCPINSKMAFKYSEVQAELAAGAYFGSVGGNIYNHNPLPSSYDRGVLVANTLYESKQPPPPAQGKIDERCLYEADGLDPKPFFKRGDPASSFNYVFGRCANLSDIDRIPLVIGAADAHTNAFNAMPNGDALSDGDVGQDVSTYDQGVYWHFVFKNNHESLPFDNTHEAAQMTQDNDFVREEHWWEHRECPENIDYLNHAFGNNINACPMNYLDVPYYAAIGKFGYFGTRFQDTWRKIVNEAQPDEIVGNVSPDINSDARSSFGNQPSGHYRVDYVTGAWSPNFESPEKQLKWKIVDLGFGPVLELDGGTSPLHDGYVSLGELFDPGTTILHGVILDEFGMPVFDYRTLPGGDAGSEGLMVDHKNIFDHYTGTPWHGAHDVTFLGIVTGKFYVDVSSETGYKIEFQKEAGAGIKEINFGNDYSSFNKLAEAEAYYEGRRSAVFKHFEGDISMYLKDTYPAYEDNTLVIPPAVPWTEYPPSFNLIRVKKKFVDWTTIASSDAVDKSAEYETRALNIGGSDYESLITNAVLEKKFYDFSFSDRVMFLKLNYNLSLSSPEYSNLAASIPGFSSLYGGIATGLFYGTGLAASDSTEFKVLRISRSNSYSAASDPVDSIAASITGSTELSNFTALIKNYGCFKLSSPGVVDFEWYDKIVNEKKKRIAKRYYGNIAEGKAVDLFPNSQITFSFEKTADFAGSDFIKYNASKSSTAGKSIPEVKRRYFSAGFSSKLGANSYSTYVDYNVSNNSINGSPIETQLFNYVDNEFTGSSHNFYFGYLNPRGCGKDSPTLSTKSYLKLINLPDAGIWKDYAPETSTPPADNTNSPRRSPWPDAGFNGIGEVTADFSCFSPMFLQQPLNEAVKLCQAPTFRVYAVDYHTIPEDKIEENAKDLAYPEIDYWLRKIKTLDTNSRNRYPLQYQWHRVLKSNAAQYLSTKNTGFLETSNPSGLWCCAEDGLGRTAECTVIKPTQCVNLDGTSITSWSAANSQDSVQTFMGVTDPDAQYLYFCNVVGRFGSRSSEFASVKISSKLKIEIASLCACGGGSANLSIAGQSFSLSLLPGFLADDNVYFEQVKDTNWNDRNNCETVRFVGPEALRGETRVYTPSTFVDSRGKKIRNAHWKDFGSLISSSISLNQNSAKMLYADRALPYCDRSTSLNYIGVPFNVKNYVHRTYFETAMLTDNTTFGVKASKLRNISELYPQRKYSDGGPIPDWEPRNPSHHQFESNLGSIKRYSSIRSNNTIDHVRLLPDGFSTDQVKRDMLMDDFDKKMDFAGSFGKNIITGPECGFVAPSMGRLMHFYVESLFTYYLLCEVGGVKPKKVKNISHIAGGLRSGRAGLQYNWLGKPNDSRLKRVSMPGPYAFQWKVERHNRDRNGNGMPLSFWSYHWEQRMENLYDAAAVYGAVKKTDPAHSSVIKGGKILRDDAAAAMYGPGTLGLSLRGASIGPDDGPKLGCGGLRWKASGDNFYGVDKPNKEFVKWMQSVGNGAGPDPFSVNGCDGVDSSSCFYPCVSLKYPEGFVPRGGKTLGYTNGAEKHLITTTIVNQPVGSFSYSTTSTPSSKIFAIDLSPCSTDKKDICNYITPTMHVGIDTWPLGNTSNGGAAIASISNM